MQDVKQLLLVESDQDGQNRENVKNCLAGKDFL